VFRSDPQVMDLLGGFVKFLHLLWAWTASLEASLGVHAIESLHQLFLLAEQSCGFVLATLFKKLSRLLLDLDDPKLDLFAFVAEG
jgi:uncharacterized membrane protein